jgi:hypothetical protein
MITHAQALAAGVTDDQLRGHLRAGRWIVVARGRYLRAWAADDPSDPHEAARLLHRRQAAMAAQSRAGSVVGYGSAALMHGLPLVSGTPHHVHLLVPPGAWTGIRGGVRSREARWLDDDAVIVRTPDDVLVVTTSVARTWVDVARTQHLADALSVGDAALRSGLMTLDAAADVLDRLWRVRGCRRAVRALALLDPLRESPLESGSAARFIDWDFPVPRLQHTFYDERGPIARSDFDWAQFSVIGFADGLGKYGLDPARDRAERHQEARLRPQGIVARWGWVDMAGAVGLYRLVAPLLGIHRPMPPTIRF